MSFNGLLIQLVLFSCLALLLRSFRTGRKPSQSIAIVYSLAAGLNLVVLGLCMVLLPAVSGWISGSVWAITLLSPLLLSARLGQLMKQEQYVLADALIGRFRRFNLPTQNLGGYWEQPTIVRSLSLAQQHRPVQATELVSPLRKQSGSIGQNANVIYYRVTAQWPEFLAWVQLNFSEQALFSTPSSLGIHYVRALGEVGKTEEMVLALERFRATGELNQDRYSFNLLRMMVFAFCGRVDLVARVLKSGLSLPEPTQAFWMATARLAACKTKAEQQGAIAEFKAQKEQADGLLAEAIAYRLKHPCAVPRLSPLAQQALYRLEIDLQTDVQTGPTPFSRQGGKTRLTFALIGLNSFIFLSEILAQWLGLGLGWWGWASGNLEFIQFANLGNLYSNTLFLSGALVPNKVLAGEWWRIISAMFLHANFVHVFSNMLGLFYYGSYVESRLKWLRFGLIYAVAGLGSMLGMMGVALLQGEPNLYGVGASGAVMGTLGAMLALVWRSWWKTRSARAGQTLRLLLILVVLQTSMDFVIPNVSASAHLSGLAIGFFVGNLPGFQPQESQG